MKSFNLKHIGLRKHGGRNNLGRITIRHRGGGHKRLYRPIEFSSSGFTTELTGIIKRIEYDPNRTAYLAECEGYNRRFYKLLGGINLNKNSLIGKHINVIKLADAAIGDDIFNVAIRPGQLGKIGRASGTKCLVLKQTENKTVIRLPSQEVKSFNNNNLCSLGSIFSEPRLKLGKAGINRRFGIRPSVRGVAMNPIDHPNGGKTPSGQPKTP